MLLQRNVPQPTFRKAIPFSMFQLLFQHGKNAATTIPRVSSRTFVAYQDTFLCVQRSFEKREKGLP